KSTLVTVPEALDGTATTSASTAASSVDSCPRVTAYQPAAPATAMVSAPSAVSVRRERFKKARERGFSATLKSRSSGAIDSAVEVMANLTWQPSVAMVAGLLDFATVCCHFVGAVAKLPEMTGQKAKPRSSNHRQSTRRTEGVQGGERAARVV